MRLIEKTIISLLFIVASGCGSSTPNAKSADNDVITGGGDVATGGGNVATGGAPASKQAECSEVENKFAQIDDAIKGAKGATIGRALVPALEKMSKEFKAAPPKTPGLDKATAELVAETDSYVSKMKELNVVFDEMEKVNQVLGTWQTNVEKVAEEFDVACNKAPQDECDALGQRITKIPHLEGDQFGQYATELDKFIKLTGESQVANPGLRAALKNMLSVLGEAVKPMRRLSELAEEPKKLDPATKQLKIKFNQVREICGLGVRKL